jgi:hypothetical protein
METHRSAQESLSEAQAAQWLGISIDALHQLLDEHIFNNGTPRPEGICFTHSDLLLLSYWCDSSRCAKVVAMPNRPR